MFIFNERNWFLLLLVLLPACNPSKSESSVKFRQYYLKGEQLYIQHCSNCHQKDGTGLRRIYPPLDSSDFMSNSMMEAICMIRNGSSDQIIVNGKTFNQPMPAFPQLSDIEVAEVSTYIYNTWSHSKGLIDVKEVSGILSKCE